MCPNGPSVGDGLALGLLLAFGLPAGGAALGVPWWRATMTRNVTAATATTATALIARISGDRPLRLPALLGAGRLADPRAGAEPAAAVRDPRARPPPAPPAPPGPPGPPAPRGPPGPP